MKSTLNDMESKFSKNLSNAGYAMIKLLKCKGKSRLALQNANGKNLVQTEDKISVLDTFFFKVFHDLNGNLPQLSPNDFPLFIPVTTAEVSTAISKLSNGQSPGSDRLPNELLKLANGQTVHKYIAQLINTNTWGTDYLGAGDLIPLPKPKKSLTPDNIRPIVLLNSKESTCTHHPGTNTPCRRNIHLPRAMWLQTEMWDLPCSLGTPHDNIASHEVSNQNAHFKF